MVMEQRESITAKHHLGHKHFFSWKPPQRNNSTLFWRNGNIGLAATRIIVWFSYLESYDHVPLKCSYRAVVVIIDN